MYNDPDCKPWTSSRWVPSGFSSRDQVVAEGNASRVAGEGAIEVEEMRNEKV